MPGSLLISSSYDAAGSLTGLATTNATFTYTANRAGHRLTETATVTGDPQNGEAQFTYDPLGRLASYSLPGIRTLGATWQADTNRATLATDGTPAATTFDAADRPTSSGFASDLDGRLTAIPARGGAAAKALEYDALGRLVSATVAGVTRTYAHDPLDRLVTVSEGGNPVVRFRYVGLTGSVAQLLDGAWAVTRNIGTDATGSPLADWAPGGTGWRRNRGWVTPARGGIQRGMRPALLSCCRPPRQVSSQSTFVAARGAVCSGRHERQPSASTTSPRCRRR